MIRNKSRLALLLGVAILAILLLVLVFDATGNVLSFGSQRIACGGEFNYGVQCPTGSYCREMPRKSLSIPYLGGTCQPASLKTLDKVEEFLFRVYR